jgi:arylsulfatase
MEIDWSVGEILKALDGCGLRDNTLVVFTSDNGPWLNYGNHAGSAYPLREGKGTIWDGGQRVPCIVSWPGRIPGGVVCRELVSAIDFLPTFCAAAGAPLPLRKIDGVNVLPLLEGKSKISPRDRFYFYYLHPNGFQLKAIRSGKWKLHFPHAYLSYEGMEPGRDGFPGPCADRETPLVLYDLERDPGERNDVAQRYPETVARLQAMAEEAREDLGDYNREGKGIRSCGRID